MEPDIVKEEFELLQTTNRPYITAPYGVSFNETPSNASTNLSVGQENLNLYYFYDSVQFTVMWSLFAAIVVGNSSVIAALLCTNARKSRMNFFIMQLAIAVTQYTIEFEFEGQKVCEPTESWSSLLMDSRKSRGVTGELLAS
ncbi:Cardioacceleratory peptide receptor [Eumeta japonica]|uniref:Cardioacceleratory peptide receptor n=1 Tax=Eumeta variegata TaxID=151549 RepID=A0A4C1T7A8_EUMVA|nr:Cardioacceleratory peptide receptor [Eumeta japonica]